MAWICLVLAGLLEVVWAVGLKYSEGFTRPLPGVATAVAMAGSFWLLATALKTIPLGTGYAVWANYHRLSGQGHQVYLSHSAAQAVVTTLAHASFAGALGYVMGRAKFSQRRASLRGLFVMLGLLGAAGLNGGFSVVENWVVTSGLAQVPWRGVGLAALFASGVFALTWLAAQRLLAKSPFRREP